MAARDTSRRLERRKQIRSRVHWTVCFWGGPLTSPVETITQDLSCQGFYCLSRVPFVPGELVACRIKVPTHHPERYEHHLLLECTVRVVRIEPANEEGFFGMGCQIEDYRLSCTSHELKQD